MASVTQTIPQFTGGISEQPDHLKFPGQVKDIVNGIPDITKGLFKRPGAERKKTTPLSDVQSGGSWFHYYRDETEGSYIGQVAADGQVRVWRCSDGQLMTTAYGSVTWSSTREYASGDKVQSNDSGTIRIYQAQATISSGGSAPTHNSGTVNDWLFVETAQTNVQNYLATSVSENLQFLTINDTTFVSNRDSTNPNTAVGTANTTTSRPHNHFAFVELLRTENGRQYALNISDTTETASLSRATRISIESDTLDESDGTGHCPGVGTQVFSVTAANSYAGTNIVSVKNGNTDITSGKDNLIFRINSLGQQGVSPDYNANASGAGGDNYRCSYNREAILLHGGEGWVTGDTVTVTLTSASGGGPMRNKWDTDASYNQNDLVRNKGNTYRATQNLDDTVGEPVHSSGTANLWEFISDSDSPSATYTIKVLEHETTQVQAKINSTDKGLIRPAPTPFDADTAVTADTILGGIKAQIEAITNQPITVEIIGTGMYLHSTSAFNLEVVEDDLMRCFQETVNDVTRLPNQCKQGLIVEVSNSQRADEDDYYLRFNGQGSRSGVGSWIECARPDIPKDLTNMPLVIQRTGITTFTVKQFTYEFRRVGDELTNPLPSFVKTSDGLPKSNSNTFVGRINKILFFRNRLAFLSGENVILSRPGTLGEPDFFAETALTVSASDPIDISASSMFPSELFDGIEINTGLLVFSTNQQFLLSSDDTVLNPDTAKLRSVSTFNYNKDIAPISLGTTVAYVDNSGKFSRFNEMANVRREGEPNVVEVSKVVPSLLPKNIDLITNSRENSIVLMGQQSKQVTSTVNLLADSQAIPNADGSEALENPLGITENISFYNFADEIARNTFRVFTAAEGSPTLPVVNEPFSGTIYARTDQGDAGIRFNVNERIVDADEPNESINPNGGHPNSFGNSSFLVDSTWRRIGGYRSTWSNSRDGALPDFDIEVENPTGNSTATKIYFWGAQVQQGQPTAFERTGTLDTSSVYGYKYLNVGEKRQQAAWFRWQFNQSLLYHFIIDDEYFFLDSEHFLQCIKLVQQETDPNLTKDNVNFLLHLDNYISISGGVVSTTPDTSTTFSNLGWLNNTNTPISKLAVIDENGKYAKVSDSKIDTYNATITVPGDWSNSNYITLGYLYDYKVDFPTLYPTKTSGNSTSADVNASLVIHRIKLHFGRSGVYETTLTRLGKDDYTELYESNMLDDYTFGSAAFLSESIKTVPIYERNLNVDITLKSTHPAPATLRALSWEGDYSPRFYQRV